MIPPRSKKLITRLVAVCLTGLGLSLSPVTAMAAGRPTTPLSATVSSTPSQTIKGWGVFPSYFRRDWDTAGDWHIFNRPAIQDAIYQLGVTHIRVDIQPRLYVSGTTVSDIVLDAGAVNDLVQQIQIARDHGVTQYITSVWSPPAIWKDNGSINGGHLIPSAAPYFVAYHTKVLQTLESRGVGLPVMISLQNEPSVNSTGYDSCVYYDTTANIELWKTVVKSMRASLDANGLTSVKIFGPENNNYDRDTVMLGGVGFPALNDTALDNALGAYAHHGYGGCGKASLVSSYPAHPKDIWHTEWSIYNNAYGSTEAAWLTGTFRHFAADMVNVGMNYWTWWRGWTFGTTVNSEDLLSGNTTPIYSKRYHVFRKLWTTVRPGWVVYKMTTTSSLRTAVASDCGDLVDLVAFRNSTGTAGVVLAINPAKGSTTMQFQNLVGSTYTVFRSDSGNDMVAVASGSLSNGSTPSLTLTSGSVNLIVSQ
ncbi:hypothetical protein [Nibricoccus sp. IMCC34717]|uniref:hypothetical protein n=1 Tax=Nibricoccus sp. IMCC34717 TaxID=3034021 RepID=UPI00384B0C34